MNTSVEKIPSRTNLGRNGEKNIVQYTFDFTDWVEKYGTGDYIIHRTSVIGSSARTNTRTK